MAWNSPPTCLFPNYAAALSQHQQSCDYAEEERSVYEAQQQDVALVSEHYHIQTSAAPSSIAAFKAETPFVFGNGGDGAMLLQSLSSLGTPQLEDTAELRQIFPPQTEAFPDSTFPPAIQQRQPQQDQALPQLPYRSTAYYAPPSSQPANSIVQPSFQQAMECPFQVDFPAIQGPIPMLPPSLRSPPQHPAVVSLKVPKLSPERRKLCSIEGCKSQARAFGKCKRHGGSKRCSTPDCDKSVQSRGLCIRHGGGSRCHEIGCDRASQSNGKCKMHGGGRPCTVVGCEKRAHLKRLCRKHGGGIKCSVIGCDKWAQRQSMCMTHLKATRAINSV